ncbi:MAG: prepilin-type N-terminal cleavage/methylation domain-containing protein [Chrysiogenetes bacterium]|nr:prepilin-type N-terminal cleavage/methylation domain-containing protein [Chrysiogenetes bacterium]
MSIFEKKKTELISRRRRSGFTMIELMVALGVFSIFLYASSGFWGTMINGPFHNQEFIADLQQTSRIALDFMGGELKQTGAGQLFTPQPPHSSPGYAIIPIKISDDSIYGQSGPLPLVTSDGGPDGPDEITVVYGVQGRVARVESDDLGGLIQLDFQLRDDTQDASVSTNPNTNPNPYPFFTGYFNPAKPSPFSPGHFGYDNPQDQTWVNSMLLIKTAAGAGSAALGVSGQSGQRAQYRVVRVTGVEPVVTPGAGFLANVNYVEEPENPLNRWFQTIADINGGTEILNMRDGLADATKNQHYLDRITAGGGTLLGCAPRQSQSDPYSACYTAMLIQMRTFFIAPPGHPANPLGTEPALAMIPYTQAPKSGSLGDHAIVLVDGVEDMQIEYFFSRNGPGIGLATTDPQLNQGVHDPLVADGAVGYQGYWDPAMRVPRLANLTGVRMSIRAGKYVDGVLRTPYEPLANRTDYSSVEDPAHPKLARITRVFMSFRNVDTPYRPKDANPIVISGS